MKQDHSIEYEQQETEVVEENLVVSLCRYLVLLMRLPSDN
jgi:hypothetical protein